MKFEHLKFIRKYHRIIRFGRESIKCFAAILCLCFIFYLMIFLGTFGKIPTYKELKKISYASGSELYSKDSVLLGTYVKIDRANVKFNDISKNAIHALIATEDARFYQHHGLDLRSSLRVFFKSILGMDESSGGGSTLSQQLAKNLYPRKDFMFFSLPINKIREMIICKRIEKIYSKDEIIELYLNVVPMSGNIYGIQRASKRFFNKDAKDLTLNEAAVLIGMLKATTTYNPKRDMEKAKARRNVVLAQMNKYGYINKSTTDSLKSQEINLHLNNEDLKRKGLAPYLAEYLRPQLELWCSGTLDPSGDSYDLYSDGLKIYTTIDSKLQKSANEAFQNQLKKLQAIFKNNFSIDNYKSLMKYGMQNSRRYKVLKDDGLSEDEIKRNFRKPIETEIYGINSHHFVKISPLDSVMYYQKMLQAGLFSMEPMTGEVKAWIGGFNYDAIQYDHVTSKRQVGSTFKPILYAAALENGLKPCQFFDNQLESYTSYNNWTPKNADNKYGGMYSMKGALTNSVNTVSAKIMMQTGVDNVIRTSKKMLIESDLPAYPSLSLGVASISLLDMVKAYSSFANKGTPVEPIFINSIYDNKGNLIRNEDLQPYHENAISEKTAALMLNMMTNVVEEGTAQRLRYQYHLDMDIAGKTGTSQRQSDGWFIGITPDLITGVWVGAENPSVHFKNLRYGQGSATALPIFAEFLKSAILKNKTPLKKHFDAFNNTWNDELDCASYIEEMPLFENDSLNNYQYFVDTDYEDDYQKVYDKVVEESVSNSESYTTNDSSKVKSKSLKANKLPSENVIESKKPITVKKASVIVEPKQKAEKEIPVTIKIDESAIKQNQPQN